MANSNLVQLIKKIAVDAVEASRPCDYRIGVVEKQVPLTVKISRNVVVDGDFLHLTQTAKKLSLKEGDRVFVLRKSGGNEYMVIDKVVS